MLSSWHRFATIDSIQFRKMAADAHRAAGTTAIHREQFRPTVPCGDRRRGLRARPYRRGWRNTANLAPVRHRPLSGSERRSRWWEMNSGIGAPGSDGIGRIYRARQDKEWATGRRYEQAGRRSPWIPGASIQPSSFAVSGDAAVVGMPADGGGAGTVAFLAKSADGQLDAQERHRSRRSPEQYAAVSGKEVKCGTDGKASDFSCSNTGLLSYMPISAVGGKRGINLSGSWGWTDPLTGKDYSHPGHGPTPRHSSTSPIRSHPEVTLGDLPRTKGANISSWREIKTYKNYALIVSDGSGDHHGIQFFDLTHLRGVVTPKHFTEDAHYDLGSIHDIVVNEGSGFAYAVGVNGGGEGCGGGLHMVDIHASAALPKFAGCFADAGTGRSKTGYTHDAQCVMYHGPDKRYTNHEICMSSNETTISIQDVTDKKNVKVLSHADYPTVGYTHQGWFTEDQKYFYLDDELDEELATFRQDPPYGTRTMVFDMSDLEQPIMKKEYIGPTKAIDHNQYVRGNRLYQSNYEAGLRILDISDPLNPREAGYLNTYTGPITANFAGIVEQNFYPFFKNGAIGVVSIRQKASFMVKDRTQTARAMTSRGLGFRGLGIAAAILAAATPLRSGSGRKASYVVNQGGASITVIDQGEARRVDTTLDLTKMGFTANAKPHHVTVEPDGSFWYVTLIGDGKVLKFDRANHLLGQVSMETPGLIYLDPRHDSLYVGRSMTATNPPKTLGVITRRDFKLVDEQEIQVPRPHALVRDYVRDGTLGAYRVARRKSFCLGGNGNGTRHADDLAG